MSIKQRPFLLTSHLPPLAAEVSGKNADSATPNILFGDWLHANYPTLFV
jgi:hypothetical protein